MTASIPRMVKKVKGKLMKQSNISIWRVSKLLGISYVTVQSTMKKKQGCKAYHKRKIQNITKEHKKRRIAF